MVAEGRYTLPHRLGWGIVVSASVLLCLEGVLRLCTFELSPLPTIQLTSALHNQHIVFGSDGQCQIEKALIDGNDSTEHVMDPQTFPCIPLQKRIVLLGGSTIQGYGVSSQQNVRAYLETLVSDAYDVVNMGAASYTSSQIKEMLPEVWSLQPDVIVVYSGHNDVIFYPEIQSLLMSNHQKIEQVRFLRHSSIFRALESTLLPTEHLPLRFDQQLQSVYQQSFSPPSTLQEIPQTHQHAIFHETNIQALWRDNIETIVEEAQQRSVQVILVTPTFRIDAPILGGLYNTKMTQEVFDEQEHCESLLQQPLPLSDPLWSTCLNSNLHYSPLHFQYGKLLWNQQDRQGAYRVWSAIREVTPAMYLGHFPERWSGDLESISTDKGVPLINFYRLWGSEQARLNSTRYFLDSLHFNASGHQLLAQEIVQQLEGLSE